MAMPRPLQRNPTKYLLCLLRGKNLCANPFLYQQPGRYLRWREYSFGALLEPVVNKYHALFEGTLRLRRNERPRQRSGHHRGPVVPNQSGKQARTTPRLYERSAGYATAVRPRSEVGLDDRGPLLPTKVAALVGTAKPTPPPLLRRVALQRCPQDAWPKVISPSHYQGGISPMKTLLIACTTPQSASRAETTRPAHDTFMDMLRGPITTDHRLIILTRCMTATMVKISADTAV